MPVRVPAHAGTFLCVVPTTHKKGNKHEQVQESIACHVALSMPHCVDAGVSVPCDARSGRQRGLAGPCASFGEYSVEAVGIRIGCPERTKAIQIFTVFQFLKKKPYWGNHFWAKGYCVDSVGLNSEMIQKYVRFQEKEEMHQEQLQLEPGRGPSQKCR